jgi:hypothetical protein
MAALASMLPSRRRRWQSDVVTLLPAFGLTVEEIGPGVVDESLELVYPRGYNAHEAVLFLAYFAYGRRVRGEPERAAALIGVIDAVQAEWTREGTLRQEIVGEWRAKSAGWETKFERRSREWQFDDADSV